jgi:GTPase SAR1 family protein
MCLIMIASYSLSAAGAGKTSLLRRFFYHSFEHGIRVPTVGSDFYTVTLQWPISASFESNSADADRSNESNHEGQLSICLQIWDTPGRERCAWNRPRTGKSFPLATDSSSGGGTPTANLLDAAFFRNADTIMLMFDMTSSASFHQLLKGYSDLLEMQRLPYVEMSTRGERGKEQSEIRKK